MQTVSIAEAAKNFPELVNRLAAGPLVVMDGDQEVAIITSAADAERERRWQALWETADRASAELEANLRRTASR